MIIKKDLYSTSEKHKGMKINIPPNLTPIQIKAFNDVTLPQLKELYSYKYDKFKFKHVNIHISKHDFPDNTNKPSIQEINPILEKIPNKYLTFATNIYFVSYHCKKDLIITDNPGRTLPLKFDILIYPKAHDRLNSIIPHEIGHVIFEKGLSKITILMFENILRNNFPDIKSYSPSDYDYFIRDQFAICYECMINYPKELEAKHPSIYNFLLRFFT